MLQAAANITPRGVYVCGNTTTTSGLTVTLTKEGGGSGNYTLEAGALVLADQGAQTSIINHTLPSTIRAVIGTLTCTSMASNSMSISECY